LTHPRIKGWTSVSVCQWSGCDSGRTNKIFPSAQQNLKRLWLTQLTIEVKQSSSQKEYTKCTSCVDWQDQILSYYPNDRNTIQWYKNIKVHVIQMMMPNANNLHCRSLGKNCYCTISDSLLLGRCCLLHTPTMDPK
jgi:hypothetical protein